MATLSIKGVEVPTGQWCTLRQGAAYAQVSYPRFTTAVKAGELPAYKVPTSINSLRVKKGDIDAWLEANPY